MVKVLYKHRAYAKKAIGRHCGRLKRHYTTRARHTLGLEDNCTHEAILKRA